MAIFALSADAAAPPDVYGWHWGPHMMWGVGWSGLFFGPLLMALLLGILIAVLFVLIRWLSAPRHNPRPPDGRPTPLDILKERFARGEIGKEEYEERRRVLRD